MKDEGRRMNKFNRQPTRHQTLLLTRRAGGRQSTFLIEDGSDSFWMVRPETPISLASTSAKPIAVQTRPPIAKKVLDDPPAKRKDHCPPGFKGQTKLNRRIAVYLRCFTLGDPGNAAS